LRERSGVSGDLSRATAFNLLFIFNACGIARALMVFGFEAKPMPVGLAFAWRGSGASPAIRVSEPRYTHLPVHMVK